MENLQDKDDFWQVGGEACRHIYIMQGLESAINFLHEMLEPRLPLSYINVISSTLDICTIIPVCSTKPSGTTEIQFSSPQKRPHYICTDVPIQDYLLKNDLTYYQKEFEKHYPIRNDLFFVGQKSLLRIPIVLEGNWVLLVQFWSKQPEAFSEKQTSQLARLLQPMAKEIQATGLSVLNASYMVSKPQESATGRELMIICEDLAPVLEKIEKVAPTDATVLITGETGVGKEIVADTLHMLSKRSAAPFIKVNCGALSESLIESELFGHEKGAFTDAHNTHRGLFELADKGTLFLDEIGELSLTAQVKLLRFLEKQTVRRIGSSTVIQLNVRIIAATNQNLEQMVRAGTFRRDLYYRLIPYPIHVPPLRERIKDILPLTHYFIDTYAKKNEKNCPKLSRKDIAAFYQYSWPGNIRELRYVIERAVINYEEGDEHLNFEIPEYSLDGAAPEFLPSSGWPTLKNLTEQYIRAVMKHTQGKVSGPGSASDILGIHYTTLRAHLRRMAQESKKHA